MSNLAWVYFSNGESTSLQSFTLYLLNHFSRGVFHSFGVKKLKNSEKLLQNHRNYLHPSLKWPHSLVSCLSGKSKWISKQRLQTGDLVPYQVVNRLRGFGNDFFPWITLARENLTRLISLSLSNPQSRETSISHLSMSNLPSSCHRWL